MTTPPLRKRHFCNDAHRDTTKIARSLEEYRDLREVCHCQHRGRQTCQVQVQNLSSLSAELVTFEPETCHVRAWNLPSPIMALVRFDPATCPVRAHPDRPRVHAHSELSCANKKSGANAQLRWRASALLRVNTTSRRLSSYLMATGRPLRSN